MAQVVKPETEQAAAVEPTGIFEDRQAAKEDISSYQLTRGVIRQGLRLCRQSYLLANAVHLLLFSSPVPTLPDPPGAALHTSDRPLHLLSWTGWG